MPLSASTFTLVSDFNLTNSAGRPFSYGRATLPGNFALYNTIAPNCLSTTGETCYSSSLGNSGLYYNGSGSQTNNSTIQQPTNFLALNPQGVGVDVRFVAPATANYSFSINVKGLDTSQVQSILRIYINGNQLGGVFINSINTTTPFFLNPTSLPIGSVIEFIVTGPANNATSGLNGIITGNPIIASTPEPSTWLALGTGLFAIASLRRRKSAQSR